MQPCVFPMNSHMRDQISNQIVVDGRERHFCNGVHCASGILVVVVVVVVVVSVPVVVSVVVSVVSAVGR